MLRLNGGCHCGNIHFEMTLPHAPETYRPRACDCDFCHKHGAAYVADPDGSLLIRLQDEHMVTRYRQGAAIADCLVCTACGVLVAIHYQDDQGERRSFAVVNSRAIDGVVRFGESIPVSPKALTASEKVERWKRLWFQRVRIMTSA